MISAYIFILCALLANALNSTSNRNMDYFPTDFKWGVASSAYQIEGATRVGGRGPSIWDTLATIPGKIKQNGTGDVACDHYNRFKEDVQLMKALGVSVYRFSISWPRIMPQGRGTVSQEGIDFYNRLINELIANDITPFVTLFHWDLPTALEFELSGFMSPKMQDLFADYAEVCFSAFGDRVKHWITLNEPYCYALLGYGIALFAPQRRSNTEPYIVAHNLLLGHAKAVDRYRRKFKGEQGGVVGITNNCDWREPLTDSAADIAAAQRALEFDLGWFADPVYFGHYPESMVRLVGDRLPKFTADESTLIKGSSDFFGLNHYSTHMAADDPNPTNPEDINSDQRVVKSDDPKWEKSGFEWNIVPWGFRKLLLWVKQRYDNPTLYVTENGISVADEDDVNKARVDTQRVRFYRDYISAMREAMQAGANIKGYMAWSILDNFEWAEGYTKRFGIVHVDFHSLKRTPKWSYYDYKRIIDGGDPGLTELLPDRRTWSLFRVPFVRAIFHFFFGA